ncbi:MAG: SDR family NAD(P)-dependent oxidoreductase [Xanthobacteraceae bacterium]
MKLEGRSILLTGAGSGIGRELAIALAGKGARLLLAGRRARPLEETATMVSEAGGTARAVAGDVCDESHRRAALDAAVNSHGGLDILINNAGNIAAGPLERIAEADIRAMIEVGLLAPILLTRTALPLLKASGGAMIVNVASGFALIGMPFYSVYSGVKAGLSQFGEALRRELIDEHVHVLTVYPIATHTPMMSTWESGAALGAGLENPRSVAAAIVEGMEKDALSVIGGGETRRAMIALNQTAPEKLDERFANNKSAIESAARRHRSM